MKRQVKKLSLSRETIHNLQEPVLGKVAGGSVGTFTSYNYCNNHSYTTTCVACQCPN